VGQIGWTRRSTGRNVRDDNVDLVIRFDYQASDSLLLGVGYGRKTRSPMYVERYLWIPLEVNSGLGDLNNYVGNVNLEPEVSDQLEFSLDWTFASGFLRPRLFHRAVDDFIQGVASNDPVVIAVSGNANGDPTPMLFTNVDAERYGFDLVARIRFSGKLSLDGTVISVRGKRTDVSDNLFRIAPLNARVALTTEMGDWSLTAESVTVAEQDKISRELVENEPLGVWLPGPGLNAFGQVRISW
jgi:iron complex outermembrane receptor protein